MQVRIKQRPDEIVEVTAHEAEVLRGQGLLLEEPRKRNVRSAADEKKEVK